MESKAIPKNVSLEMSEIWYLLDPGHGGCDPQSGEYLTPGKRSPRLDDGRVLYEGVQNREIVAKVLKKCEDAGIAAIDIVNTYRDVDLSERVRRANELGRELKCIYISVHANGAGNGKDFNSASGIEVFTSKGDTGDADDFAEVLINELICQFGDSVKWRFDTSDGDRDKEAHFYVLRKTNMPSVLAEIGFMTNKEEAERMFTEEWDEKAAQAIFEAIQHWEIKNE